jgi:hypothetical protein
MVRAPWVLLTEQNVDLYIHSPVCLHGVVRNQLSTGTSLPFTLYCNESSAASEMKPPDVKAEIMKL